MRKCGYLLLSFLMVLGSTIPVLAQEELISPGATEVVDERTITSRTWDNGDGTRTTEFSSEPLNYQDDQGIYQPVSTILEPVMAPLTAQNSFLAQPMSIQSTEETYDYQVTKNIFSVYLGANAAEPIKFQMGGNWIKFRALDGANVKGVVEGSRITFSDVWPNTDLRYTMQPGGLKEEIVIKAPGGPSQFKFQMETSGVKYKKVGQGYQFIGLQDNQPGWLIPKPFALEQGNPVPFLDQVKEVLVEDSGSTFAILSLDSAWVNSQGRKYPIVIDPYITVSVSGDHEIKLFDIDFAQKSSIM